MYLVDTSAWIDALQTRPRAIGRRLQALEAEDTPLYLCGPVLQEILQGARDDLTLQRYRRALSAMRCVTPLDPIQSYAEAGRLYARCRWLGVAPRSATDCFIAQLAIENGLALLHDDADFLKIASVEPALMLAERL